MENEQATIEFIDDEEWIHTGDLGYFDETLNFYIIDRKKDTLKYYGYARKNIQYSDKHWN